MNPVQQGTTERRADDDRHDNDGRLWTVTSDALTDESGDGLLDVLARVADTLSAGNYAGVPNRELLGMLDSVERAARALSGVGYEIITHLRRQNAGAELGCVSLIDLLADRLRITLTDARDRMRTAEDLGPQIGISGERLPAYREATAAARRDGAIGIDHARIIRRFLLRLPGDVDAATRCYAEDQLVDLARTARPEHVKAAAERLAAYLDPDGSPGDERARRRKVFFQIGSPGPDGLSTGRFCVDAELRSYIEALFAVYARPGRCNPDNPNGEVGDSPDTGDSRAAAENPGCDDDSGDHEPGDHDSGNHDSGDDRSGTDAPRDDGPGDVSPEDAVRDMRSAGQRQHDALKAALRAILASGGLGTHRGLPVRVVITARLGDLERAAGFGMTGGGSLIPMREVIRMASHSYQYLSVFDDEGRPLYLGRSKRIASADQRLVLYAGEGGCTFPSCTSPAYRTQVHHVNDWAHGGATDIDTLTLACDRHHALVGDGPDQWATTRAGPADPRPGRTLWHPPVGVDPERRGRINHYHHPGEYLTDAQHHRYPTYRPHGRFARTAPGVPGAAGGTAGERDNS
ncbi:MAG: HNH endonuclease [Tomitella sp.]|nr:HNH endonuclease [Tomitella sp.]